MINLSVLAKELEKKLNDNKQGFKFKVFADTGNYKAPERNGNDINEPINCVLRLVNSEVTNLVSGKAEDTAGLMFATQTCSFSLVYSLKGRPNNLYILSNGKRVEELPEDMTGIEVLQTIEGYLNKVESLRYCLDSAFQGTEQKVLEDSDKKSYHVGITYQFGTSGIREQQPGVGDSFTYQANVYYMFVENGVNSRNITFELDGIVFPYQRVTLNNTPTLDGNVYATDITPTVRNMASQKTFNASFFLPATENGVVDIFVKNTLYGEPNEAHILKLDFNGRKNNYLVIVGGVDFICETVQNVGINITLLESVNIYDLVNFGENLSIYGGFGDITFANSEVFFFYDENGIGKEYTAGQCTLKEGQYLVTSATPQSKGENITKLQ